MADRSNLQELQITWEELALADPLWAVLTHPEKHGNRWDSEEFFATGREEINELMDYVNALAIPLQFDNALDFGCGVGRLTQPLATHFDKCYGIDIAPTMIALATQYNQMGERCEYILNETDNLQIFGDNSLSFVYTNLVLQHMHPQFAFSYIKEFLRVLKPGGLLIFKLPVDGTLWGRFKVSVKQRLPFLIRLYRKQRFGSEQIMDTHYIKRQEIIHFVEANGGQMADMVDFGAADHLSCRYCVTKL